MNMVISQNQKWRTYKDLYQHSLFFHEKLSQDGGNPNVWPLQKGKQRAVTMGLWGTSKRIGVNICETTDLRKS